MSLRVTDELGWELLPSDQPAVDRLFSLPAFSKAAKADAFVPAMRDAVTFQLGGCAEYRALARGFDVDALTGLEDVEQIPWILVSAFKERGLRSQPIEEVHQRIRSSGTGGRPTEIGFDRITLNRMHVADRMVHMGMGVLEQDGPGTQLLFSYDIAHSPELGPALSTYIISEMTPYTERRAQIRLYGTDLRFDLETAVQDYVELVSTGLPMRWIGYPAFMLMLIDAIESCGLPTVPRPDESWVQPAGGWKTHERHRVSREAFGARVQEVLGIPARNVRDLFGMTEHGVAFLECSHGRMHVSSYSHAVARDPWTLERVPDGQPGLLHLFTPMVRTHPFASVLTLDYGTIDRSPCPCGRYGDGLIVQRRVGLSARQTCAIRALDYLPLVQPS